MKLAGYMAWIGLLFGANEVILPANALGCSYFRAGARTGVPRGCTGTQALNGDQECCTTFKKGKFLNVNWVTCIRNRNDIPVWTFSTQECASGTVCAPRLDVPNKVQCINDPKNKPPKPPKSPPKPGNPDRQPDIGNPQVNFCDWNLLTSYSLYFPILDTAKLYKYWEFVNCNLWASLSCFNTKRGTDTNSKCCKSGTGIHGTAHSYQHCDGGRIAEVDCAKDDMACRKYGCYREG